MVLRYAALSGARILVGQSAAENDALCAAAEPHDLWFHLEGDSSPHVILQCAGEPCAQAIADCCQLCKNHSKKKAAKWAKVIWLPSRSVKKVRGDAPGTVRLSQQPASAMVAVDTEALKRLAITRLRARDTNVAQEQQPQRPTKAQRKGERKAARQAKRQAKRLAKAQQRRGSTASVLPVVVAEPGPPELAAAAAATAQAAGQLQSVEKENLRPEACERKSVRAGCLAAAPRAPAAERTEGRRGSPSPAASALSTSEERLRDAPFQQQCCAGPGTKLKQ